jgi:hypothetical protein
MLAKLPKWAQDHIRMIERKRDEAREQRLEFLDVVTPHTDAYIEDGIRHTFRALSKYESASYRMGQGLHDRMIVDYHGNILTLRANFGRIQIEPTATNCIEIRTVPL